MVGAQFKARNIDFILNDIVETFPESDSGEVVLKSGQKVQADLIVSRCPTRSQPDCFNFRRRSGTDIGTTTKHRHSRVIPRCRHPY